MYIHEKEKAKMTDYIRNMINSLAEDILDIYKIGFRVDDINDLVQKLGGSIQMKKDFSYASLEKNGDGFKIMVFCTYTVYQMLVSPRFSRYFGAFSPILCSR